MEDREPSVRCNVVHELKMKEIGIEVFKTMYLLKLFMYSTGSKVLLFAAFSVCIFKQDEEFRFLGGRIVAKHHCRVETRRIENNEVLKIKQVNVEVGISKGEFLKQVEFWENLSQQASNFEKL